ncbi:MAG TPA: CopG family antitoxin [Stellaceae bacterium]|jgi:hypothetical protein
MRDRSAAIRNQLPKLDTEEEAAEFLARADLTEYDLSGFRTVQFEFKRTAEGGAFNPAARPSQ